MKNKIVSLIYFIGLTFLFSGLSTNAQMNEGSIEKNKYTTEYIEERIKDIIPKNLNIIYTIVPRGLVISVPTNEIFDDKQQNIKESAKSFLYKLGNIIKTIDYPSVVEGNVLTQTADDELSNLELSIIRAEKLVEFFINKCNIPPLNIRAIGFGEMLPFEDNVSYKEHMNKRIDFVILNYEWNR